MITIKSQAKNLHADAPTIDPPVPGRPGPVVTVTAVLMALWCIGFAAVNLVFVYRFSTGTWAVWKMVAIGLTVLYAFASSFWLAERIEHRGS